MNYRVRLTNDFRSISGAETRSRAGISIDNGQGYTGSLTSEQLKELQDDQYVIVTKEDGSALSKSDESLPANPTSTEYEVSQSNQEEVTTPVPAKPSKK